MQPRATREVQGGAGLDGETIEGRGEMADQMAADPAAHQRIHTAHGMEVPPEIHKASHRESREIIALARARVHVLYARPITYSAGICTHYDTHLRTRARADATNINEETQNLRRTPAKGVKRFLRGNRKEY